jgi:photosystem II stability/assembly factor-like uncharacterized protein
VTDARLDPSNPDVIYAAAYQRRRTPFGFNGGGPGSGIYKSTDAGKTWTKLTKGLPEGDKGRIGLCVYPKNPQIVYAIVEDTPGSIYATTGSGGVFRTEDGGQSWTKQSNLDPRPMYYSTVVVDPTDDRKLWVLGVNLHYSEDAGKTWVTRPTQKIHSDFHAMWVDPKNPNRILAGCDGGIWWSNDNGRTWEYNNNLAIGQFYEVSYDMRKPYWVYGGLQDNFAWGGPSATPYNEGITNDDWVNIGGGDGFHTMVDPTNNDIVYQESQNGGITRLNMATGERKGIRPRPPQGEPANSYRFDWNTPILISPHNPKKLLMGGNRLFLSRDRGDSWQRTEDLSTQPDRSKMPIMGVLPSGKILSKDDGQDSFGQIICLTESPLKEGLIYVGTDDGNLQLSRDDGKTWKNIAANVPGVPKGTYVRRLVASRYAEGRVYAAFDNHRNGDFKPYLYVSEDYGQTWQPISYGIPEGSTLHVIREHFRNPNLLFAGTERGAYVSLDRGAKWTLLGAPLPIVPVDDIQIHPRENDLILATHGRSIYILDDITPMEQLAEKALPSDFYLFDPRGGIEWRMSSKKGFRGDKLFQGNNPPSGALIQYYLKEKPKEGETLKLQILDRSGKNVVSEFRLPDTDPGVNRALWDMRLNPPVASAPPSPARGNRGSRNAASGGRGGRPGGPGMRGPRVLPGTFLVRLTVGTRSMEKPLVVEDDPRLRISDADRRANYDLLVTLNGLYATTQEARRALERTTEQVKGVRAAEGDKEPPAALKPAIDSIVKRAEELDEKLTGARRQPQAARPAGQTSQTSQTSQTGQARQAGQANGESGEADRPRGSQPSGGFTSRIQQLVFSLDSLTEAPSAHAREETKAIAKDLKLVVQEINALNDRMVAGLNRQLRDQKLKEIAAPAHLVAPR